MNAQTVELLKQICSPLKVLAKSYHSRADYMAAKGWSSFQPSYNLPNELVDSSTLEELKLFEHDECIQELGKHSHSESFRTKLRLEAEELYANSGNELDLEYPSYTKYWRTIERYEPDRFYELIERIKQEFEIERRRELSAKTKGYARGYDESNPRHRKQIYRDIMDNEGGLLGFARDSAFSSNQMIYSKPICGDWKVGFYIDSSNLLKKGRGASGKKVGKIEFYFSIVSIKNIHYDLSMMDSCITFIMNSLVPTGRLPKLYVYDSFRSLTELEVCLLAYLDMYASLQEQFESLALEGLNRAKHIGILD
ncbi:MAG: hypothetical protein R3183_11570 [Oleiphilaceae bacterium]|nr:hypothetical protein [Oleiphilaceae bacterium]